MTATRAPALIPPRAPHEGLKTGATASATHATALAWLANEVVFRGGLCFRLGRLTVGNTSPTYRIKGPTRLAGGLRLWTVVPYMVSGYVAPGNRLLRITHTGGVAPINAADREWATGLNVEVQYDGRRAMRPLHYVEVVNAGYTLPSAAEEFVFQLVWAGSGSSSLGISSITCEELCRVNATSGSNGYGVDPGNMDARQPITAWDNIEGGGGVDLLASLAIYGDRNCARRYLWGDAADSAGSIWSVSNSATYEEPYPRKLRVHPRPKYRVNPGRSYGPIRLHVYAQNSDTSGGTVRIKTKYDTTGVTLTGWPIGSYGWQSTTINAYLGSLWDTPPGEDFSAAVASPRGILNGKAAGDDTDADGVDRSASDWEEEVTLELKSKVSGGDTSNDLTIRSWCLTQE